MTRASAGVALALMLACSSSDKMADAIDASSEGDAGAHDADAQDADAQDADAQDAESFAAQCWAPGLIPPCCQTSGYQAPEGGGSFHLSYLKFQKPLGWASPVFDISLIETLRGKELRWGISLAEVDGTTTLRTGGIDFVGEGEPDAHATFYSGSGPNQRFAPVTMPAEVNGNRVTAGPAEDPLIMPTFIRTVIQMSEMQLEQLAFDLMLDEDRACIGEAKSGPVPWATNGSSMTGFLLVDSVAGTESLFCARLIGADCDQPRDMWTRLPDSLCGADGCEEGQCDPVDECNAYLVQASVGGSGIPIGP